MQKGNGDTISNEKDACMSEEYNKLSYETALDNVRFYTTEIWKENPAQCDVLTPVLCNICLKNELLHERFSTVTAADVLADISIENQKEALQKNGTEPPSSDEDDFFTSVVFNLKQECDSEIPNNIKEQDPNQSDFWGDVRTVGFGRNEERQIASYNEPFDPRLAFAGLQDVAFTNSRFLKPNDEPQENVCLAVDDVSEIVHEYLNKYHDHLTDLRSPPGDWVDQPDAVLPSKFASYNLWTADKNEINVEKETDPQCRLLAAKVSSHSVKRLWSDGSSYTPSTSDDQETFSHQGSVSEESTPPLGSATIDELGDFNVGFPDAFSYPFFQSTSEKEFHCEPISQLWSGRNVDSFKDFVPRLSYGFNLPVPDVVLEENSTHNDNSELPTDEEGQKCASKFFNIWCVPDPDDGQGDRVSSRCSEKSDSPPGGQSLSEKSSPEAGLQIPRLVSSKRRERPIRGTKNTRRCNVTDYQVRFVDCADSADKTRCRGPNAVSSSRAAFSDTTVWTVRAGDENLMSRSDANRGFSRSETHQEFRTKRAFDKYYPVMEKIELSAKSEPFFPRGAVPGYSLCDSPTGANLTTIDELTVNDMKNSFLETLEKRTSLSPTCEPFVPRTTHKDAEHQHSLGSQYQEYTQPQIFRQELHSDSVVNSPENQKKIGPYVPWSPATDTTEDAPVREYELFGTRKTCFDEASFVLKKTEQTGKYMSEDDQRENANTVMFPGSDWQKPPGKDKGHVTNSWDIWKNPSETSLSLGDVSWGNIDSKKLEPVCTVQNTAINTQPKSTVTTTHWQSSANSTSSSMSIQPQFNRSFPVISQSTSSLYQHHRGISSLVEKPELTGRVIRPQSQTQLEFKPSLDMIGRSSYAEPRVRQFQTVASPWTGTEASILTPSYPHQEGNRFLQSQVRASHGVPILSSQVACLPAPQQYDTTYRKMVVLHPHPKRPDPRTGIHTTVFPHTFASQPTLKQTTFQTLRQPLAPGVQRVPLDQHTRLQPSVISRPNTAFAPAARFAPGVPTQTYRHVTVAANYNAPKLVAVPTFDAHPQPSFFTSYLNFNNHNEDYRSDSDILEASVDPIIFRDEEQDHCERRVKARPIRANPANLIHIT